MNNRLKRVQEADLGQDFRKMKTEEEAAFSILIKLGIPLYGLRWGSSDTVLKTVLYRARTRSN